jgi:hypothetical protein
MMPQSTLNKKPAVTIKHQAAKPKVTEEQSINIINNLFEQLDRKEAEELEDINASAAIMTELNKPIAFNKEDQLYNKYNIAPATASNYESGPSTVGVPAAGAGLVGQVHNTSNPFSKKRKLDEICQSVIAETKTEKQQLPMKPPQSTNTSYFDAKSQHEIE